MHTPYPMVLEMNPNKTVCRLCLAINTRMITIAETPMQLMYEKITNNKLITADMRPVTLCCICYAQLNKCHKLMLTSHKAESILTESLEKKSKITDDSVDLTDRQPNNLWGLMSIFRAESINIPPFKIKIESVCKDGREETKELKHEKQVTEDVLIEKQNQESLNDDDFIRISATEKPYECKVCLRRFVKKSFLKSHSITHTSEKPYECSICHRLFWQKSGFNSHLESHVVEIKSVQTNVDQDPSRQKTSLSIDTDDGGDDDVKELFPDKHNDAGNVLTDIQKHETPKDKSHVANVLIRIYSEGKPYECKFCSRRFVKESYLKSHAIAHMFEKPSGSNVSQRRYYHKSSFTRLKPHSFEKSKELTVIQERKMISSPKELPNENCSEHQLGVNFSLKKPVTLCSAVDYYQCDVCQLRFCDKKDLNEHLFEHTDVHYECNICHSRFTHKQNLDTHCVLALFGIVTH